MKNPEHQKIHLIAAAITLSLLVGCQEDSGGGATGEEQMIQITHENAQGIASQSIKNSTSLGGASSGSGRSFLDGANSIALSRSSTTRADNVAECDKGGSITIIGAEDSNGDGEVNVIEVELNDCVFESGSVFDGDMTVGQQIEATDDGEGEVVVIVSKHLSISDQGETIVLDNLLMATAKTESSYVVDFDAELTTREGKVIIETEPYFKGENSSPNPDTGIMTVKGANGSFVSLDADTGSNETVLVTTNDGTSTQSEILPWNESGSESSSTSGGGSGSSGSSSGSSPSLTLEPQWYTNGYGFDWGYGWE